MSIARELLYLRQTHVPHRRRRTLRSSPGMRADPLRQPTSLKASRSGASGNSPRVSEVGRRSEEPRVRMCARLRLTEGADESQDASAVRWSALSPGSGGFGAWRNGVTCSAPRQGSSSARWYGSRPSMATTSPLLEPSPTNGGQPAKESGTLPREAQKGLHCDERGQRDDANGQRGNLPTEPCDRGGRQGNDARPVEARGARQDIRSMTRPGR